MRVAVVNTQTPFASGSEEWIAARLCELLEVHGHSSELIRIPFCATPPEAIVDHMLAARLVRLDNVDRAIALGFPAYFLPHDDKVIWLLRQFRQAYDLWGTSRQELPSTPLGRNVRASVLAADRAFLPEARRLYARSAVASRRLSNFAGLASEILYPPLRDPDMFRCDEYGDYVLALCRITADAGQQLAVEAMGLVQGTARLVIAGPPDGPGALRALRDVARALGVDRRVEFIPDALGDAEKVRLLAGCGAVLCLPEREGCGGRLTLAAFQSHKPVVVLAADGEVPEHVREGVSGRIATSVTALATAIDELAEDSALSRRYGDAAFRQMQDSGISWTSVVQELTR
jgi:glycosyltransferase involved in cell wall biosynthesis